MKKNDKQRLFEVMGKLDKSFKPPLNESVAMNQNEKAIFNDIMSETLDESINFNSALGKIKEYGRKGLLTITLLTALLTTNAFSQEQKEQIKNVAQTELTDADYSRLIAQTQQNIAQLNKETEKYQIKNQNDPAIFTQAQEFMKNPSFKQEVENYLKNTGRTFDDSKKTGEIMSTSPEYLMVAAMWNGGDEARKFLFNTLNKHKKTNTVQYNPQAFN